MQCRSFKVNIPVYEMSDQSAFFMSEADINIIRMAALCLTWPPEEHHA